MAQAKGVGISSLTLVRSFTPNATGLDPNEPFQFQGASIVPTLDGNVPRTQDAVLRLFFVVYPDSSISSKPTVEIEFLQNGNTLNQGSAAAAGCRDERGRSRHSAWQL